jgi:hypothetical protein
MGLMTGINAAWIPYWCQERQRYKKVKHLDSNKAIIGELENIYKWGGILPIISIYRELDKIKKKINILYAKL